MSCLATKPLNDSSVSLVIPILGPYFKRNLLLFPYRPMLYRIMSGIKSAKRRAIYAKVKSSLPRETKNPETKAVVVPSITAKGNIMKYL